MAYGLETYRINGGVQLKPSTTLHKIASVTDFNITSVGSARVFSCTLPNRNSTKRQMVIFDHQIPIGSFYTFSFHALTSVGADFYIPPNAFGLLRVILLEY